jgi:hypothetical protein
MADAVTLTFKLSASFSSETFANTVSTCTVTPEAGSDTAGVKLQTIGTTWEALDLGDVDVSKRYFVCVTNKSDTDIVTVKAKLSSSPTYGVDHALHPGEGMVFPMPAQSGSYPQIGALFTSASGSIQLVASDVGTPA